MRFGLKDKKQLLMLFLIVLTVLFIFVQSMLPPELSMKESEAVSDAIFDDDADEDSPFANFIRVSLRKIAHFAEYGILAAETFVFLLFSSVKDDESVLPIGIKKLLFSLNFGLIVAFLDESIQIISSREAKVKDVWIDVFGYATFTVLSLLIVFIVRNAKYRRSSKID